MSKSAIAALTKAQEVIAAAGIELNINLAGYVTDADVRKNWRNADALAALIINSAANAFQCENSETFAENAFDDMAEAVERYIESNLDSWNGKSWTQKNTGIELDRLAAMVAANMAFETRVALVEEKHTDTTNRIAAERDQLTFRLSSEETQRALIANAHDEALEVNARRRIAEFFGGMDYAARCAAVDAAHAEALEMNARYNAAMVSGLNHKCCCRVADGKMKLSEALASHEAMDLAGVRRPSWFFESMNDAQRNFIVSLAHADALEENERRANKNG